MSTLNECFPDTDWHKKCWLPFQASKWIELTGQTLPLVSDLWLRLWRCTSYFPCSYSPLLTEPGSATALSGPSADMLKQQHPANTAGLLSSQTGSPTLVLSVGGLSSPQPLRSHPSATSHAPASVTASIVHYKYPLTLLLLITKFSVFSPSKILHIFNSLHLLPASISRCHIFSPSILSLFLYFSMHESGSFLSSVPAGRQCHESTSWREMEPSDLGSSSLPRTGQSFTCNDRSPQPQEPFVKGT